MSSPQKIPLRDFSDSRGSLAVLQGDLPFDVKRIYWIYGADGQTRGGHRHKVTHQALISVAGAVTVYINDGESEFEITLDRPNQYLLVRPQDWHTLRFGNGSVLLVFASHDYDQSDYITQPYKEA